MPQGHGIFNLTIKALKLDFQPPDQTMPGYPSKGARMQHWVWKWYQDERVPQNRNNKEEKKYIGNNKMRQFQNARGAQGSLCCRGFPSTTHFTSWTKGIPCPCPPCLLGVTWRVQLLQGMEAVLSPPHMQPCLPLLPLHLPGFGLTTSHSPAAEAAAVHEVVLSWQEVCSLHSSTYLLTTLKERDKASAQPLHPGGQQAFWQVSAVLGDY